MAINWLSPSSYYTVVCRPALPKDTEDVLALTRLIWEGRDYVPHVWEEWLAEPEGLLAVAEYGGRVVGVNRLAPLGNNEWWMQALRVHPAFEGRGIASRLHDYVLEYWEKQGGVVRLATSAHRLPVHHLCRRSGFHLAAELMGYAAQALDEPCDHLRPVSESQLEPLARAVHTSPELAWTGGLLDLIWVWAEPSRERLLEIVKEGRAFGWGGDPGSPENFLLVDSDENEDGLTRHLQLLAIACPVEALPQALLDFRRLAMRLGCNPAGWVAPVNAAAQAALESSGFQPYWERSLYLFEKRAGADMV